uniref:Kazal-like domain-containing protein n=1 Tax=Opuntia streptacantha TaxID=393608 RepID=A0A7C9DZL8_OPUST
MARLPLPSSLIFALIVLSFSTTVQSEVDSSSSVLGLPSDGAGADLCLDPVGSALSCPVKCFRPDPVCGEDGVTYWCGCADAYCAGTRVVKLGHCGVGNGGSGPLSGQALLLVHIVWLIVLGFSVLCGFL